MFKINMQIILLINTNFFFVEINKNFMLFSYR